MSSRALSAAVRGPVGAGHLLGSIFVRTAQATLFVSQRGLDLLPDSGAYCAVQLARCQLYGVGGTFLTIFVACQHNVLSRCTPRGRKIIDFGVAKAINQPLTERTLYTGLT